MDNYSQRSRKRVSRKVLRQRQITALAVIALLVLIFFILIAKGCSNSSGGSGKNTPAETTTTTAYVPIVTEPVATTTVPVTTVNPAAEQVKLSKREMFLDIGQTDVSIISVYPDGSSEANEVWTSKDPRIAVVDNLGYVTGISAGETYIILSFNNNPGVEIEIKVSVADGSSPTPTSSDGTGSAETVGRFQPAALPEEAEPETAGSF